MSKRPIPKTYRDAKCCESCVKCIINRLAYYEGGDEFFCNANGDVPLQPDWLKNDDVAFKRSERLHAWKKSHEVKAGGYCDEYKPKKGGA